jgi:Na+/H+-dicarboxylate symporter
LLLILGIDQFLDMGRSATNVIGNSLAAAAVAKLRTISDPANDLLPAAAIAVPG